MAVASRVMLTLPLLAALAIALLWAGQRRLIYYPFGSTPPPADVGLPTAESVSFPTSDGLMLGGWFVPSATHEARLAVIVFNGNAGNRSLRAPLAARLAAHGIATLLMDYRGYGGNEGSPSEEGLLLDARAAHSYITRRHDVDPARLVYFGESLGTGVAVQLATTHRPLALILRSPFTSLVDVGHFHYPFLPVRFLLRDRFDSLTAIRRIGCPLLVIAGDRDLIVPTDMSRRLYTAAAEPKRLMIIDGADHNDHELLAGDQLITALLTFLESV